MRRSLSIIGLVLGATLLLGSGVHGVRDESGRTLMYFFSMDDSRHRSRALQLEAAVRDFGKRVAVVGLVRGAVEPDIRGLEAFRDQHGLTYELIGAAEALDRMDLPAALAEQIEDGAGDYAVLVDATGRVVAGGPGENLASLLEALVPKRRATEIDESTWGKIKVLFK